MYFKFVFLIVAVFATCHCSRVSFPVDLEYQLAGLKAADNGDVAALEHLFADESHSFRTMDLCQMFAAAIRANRAAVVEWMVLQARVGEESLVCGAAISLVEAASMNNFEVLAFIFQRSRIRIHALDYVIGEALEISSFKGHFQIVSLLVESSFGKVDLTKSMINACIVAVDNGHQQTAVYLANAMGLKNDLHSKFAERYVRWKLHGACEDLPWQSDELQEALQWIVVHEHVGLLNFLTWQGNVDEIKLSSVVSGCLVFAAKMGKCAVIAHVLKMNLLFPFQLQSAISMALASAVDWGRMQAAVLLAMHSKLPASELLDLLCSCSMKHSVSLNQMDVLRELVESDAMLESVKQLALVDDRTMFVMAVQRIGLHSRRFDLADLLVSRMLGLDDLEGFADLILHSGLDRVLQQMVERAVAMVDGVKDEVVVRFALNFEWDEYRLLSPNLFIESLVRVLIKQPYHIVISSTLMRQLMELDALQLIIARCHEQLTKTW